MFFTNRKGMIGMTVFQSIYLNNVWLKSWTVINLH